MQKIIFSIILLATFCTCSVGLATPMTVASTIPLPEFKLRPRISVWGITGNNTIGQSQILVPLSLYSNHTKTLIGLLEGSAIIHSNTWLAGTGLIHRQIINDRIYGGYLIVDYNRSAKNNGFWIINSGLEIMGGNWDFNLNAYFPLNSSKQNYQITKWGEDFGITNYIEYTGHKSYDRQLQLQHSESVTNGVDFKIGRRIPYSNISNTKIYFGGYHFQAKDADKINGITTKLIHEINQYTAFEITHTYDNYNRHRTWCSMRITLGGYSKQEQQIFGIASRLLDPIDHGYGTTTTPIKQITGTIKVIDDKRHLRYDNIWFINNKNSDHHNQQHDHKNNGGISGDGTYEHPLNNLSNFDSTSSNTTTLDYIIANSNVGAITKHPMLYFAPGNYNLASFTDNDKQGSKLQLPTGWEIHGRSADYKHRADGDERPILVGNIELSPSTLKNDKNYKKENKLVDRSSNEPIGGNNVLDSITLCATKINNENSNEQIPAILSIINARNVELNNIKIGNNNPTTNKHNVGLYLENAEAQLRDVAIHSYNNSKHQGSSYGVFATNSTINFVDGINNINAIDSGNNATATGIAAFDHSIINFRNGNNNINAISSSFGFPLDPASYGIIVRDFSQVNFQNGITNVSATSNVTGVSPTATTIGISANYNAIINFRGGENNITSNATIANDATGEHSMANAVTLEINNNSAVDFHGGNNTINAISFATGITTSAESIGAIAIDNSTINFSGGINIINTSSLAAGTSSRANSVGVKANDYSAINFQQGKNTINNYAKFTAISSNNNSGNYSSRTVGVGLFNEGTVNFIGGTNNINSFSTGDANQTTPAATASHEAFGLNTYGANVNFKGGINNFSVISAINSENNIKANAYGIAAYSSNLNFDNKNTHNLNIGVINKNKISCANNICNSSNITATNNTVAIDKIAHGIYADQETHLRIETSEISPAQLTELLNYTNITRIPNQYTGGNKITWDVSFTPW